MAFVKVEPNKSYLNLDNTGTSDIEVKRLITTNARPGQMIILDRNNRVDPGDSLGKIYLVSDIDPSSDDTEAGNIRLPQQDQISAITTQGYDKLEIKYNKTVTGSAVYKITKTLVTLMFDGSLWNVINITENNSWESV